MIALAATRHVVALEIAGTVRLVVEAADAAAAIARAFDQVRRADIETWRPRRAEEDHVAADAWPDATRPGRFDVALPFLGTAYVTVEAPDATAAIAKAYDQVTADDLDDWRPVRGPEAFIRPSVALEADTDA